MTPPAFRARVRRSRDAIFVFVFLSGLAAPAIDMWVRDDAARGPAPEMREAAPMPSAPTDLVTLSQFPHAFEAHFADTFGLRDELLRLHSIVLYHAFAMSPTPNILVGKDGWLFWAGDLSAEVFRGVAPLTAEELAGWQYMLEARTRSLAKSGCGYVWVVAPNKETIYPERMPAALRPIGPTRLDQFAAWMKERSHVDVLDLRPAMLAEKQHDTGPLDAVSTPYGTHWTGRGSVTAAREIVDHLARDHPEAARFDAATVDMLPTPAGADSLAGNLYMADLLRSADVLPTPRAERSFDVIESQPETMRHMVTRARANDVLPPTLMFHDSFGPFVLPLLAANCRTLETFGGQFDPHVVDPAHTRIVIELFVERAFVTLATDHVVPPDLAGSTENFDALPGLLFDLFATPDAGTAVAGMPLERIDIDGHPALRMTLQGARQGLELGPMTLPARGGVFVRIDVDSPEPGLLDVAWRARETPKYKRSDRTSIALDAGRTQRILLLPSLGRECVLLVRPREDGVPVTLRAFTVRTTP